MANPTLSSCILRTLQSGHVDDGFVAALLTLEKNKARNRTEGVYWDYKEALSFDDKFKTAEFVRDIAAFHNTNGGVIIVGITNEYAARGVPRSSIIDTVQLRDKVRPYLGSSVDLFQDSFEIHNGRFIWLVFARKYDGGPQSMLRNGPDEKPGRPLFVKGDYYYREADQVKRCIDDADIERVFRGFRSEHLNAYNYQVDENYFRLLMPDYERFVGRQRQIEEVKDALESRHPVVALDGLGGVGKTAVAIEAVRQLYDERRYYFIVSLSAKSRVWLGYIKPKNADFAGLHGLLWELASVFPEVPKSDDTATLKSDLINFMKEARGLILVDNLEEISDEQVLRFLGREVPDPVKVLITSRVDKKIGPLTISIPAMDGEEAAILLGNELERLGCNYASDQREFREILTAAGGVPLAIKWAAQIASERRSLHAASSILRGAGSGKQELLSFCFATMYDALSSTAKDVGLLIPYLGKNWTIDLLAIVLDLSADAVRIAVHELSDKGIIFRVDERTEGYGILPLANDFLWGKFSENENLKKRANRNFGEVFSSERGEDVLAYLSDWEANRTADFLFDLATEKLAGEKYEHALKIVKLAQTQSSDPRLRFIEGKILYIRGNKPAGIMHMRQALSELRDRASAPECFFFSTALFNHGGKLAEREACEMVLLGADKDKPPGDALIYMFLDCSIQRRDNATIARMLSKLDGDHLALAAQKVDNLISDPAFYFEFDKVVLSTLDRLRNFSGLEEGRRSRYAVAYEAVRSKLLARSIRSKS